ncbi:uncharacterized protein LOC118420670 [Branchiostoma floridae]|uniref:Uncharacterized protein LOC118420670 n=1 Tax=Branchiostoma floridae TaxID=7739 RepID=A0A9J7LIA0_BRAFL|nr:uncharacterized protein LOC118420670 [Branchiostoma floridae]
MATSAQIRAGKKRETLDTEDKTSILDSQTWQTVNSEVNLSFLLPLQLAGSIAAKDVFQQDATQGSLPTRHSTVSFLGDARAGKTSLEKHLLEKPFDPAEVATKGLEFDLVQTDVTKVGEGWQVADEGPYSRYNTGRAHYVALQILRELKSVVDPPKFLGPGIIALLNYALALALIAMMTVLSVGFQLGFGVALLLQIGIFKLIGQGYYASGIYATHVIVIHLAVDFFTRYGFLRSIFIAFGNEQSVGYPYIQYVMFVIVIVIVTFVVVLPWPVGGRRGIALAFCLMSAPTQLHFEDLASHFQLTVNAPSQSHTFLFVAAIFVGIVVSSSRRRISGLLVLLLTALAITNTADNGSESLDVMLSLVGGVSGGATGFITCDIMRRLCNFNRRGLQLEVLMGPIGFVYGIGLCWIYGWRMVLPSTWTDGYYIVPNIVAMFLIVQTERQRVYLASQEIKSYPALLVGRSIRTLNHVKDLPLKFTLIDFAGDTVYHCTHHLFLSNLTTHLIVFNMERLEQEPDYIRRIYYWVQSVIVHVQNPNPHIFIVGTHTNSLPVDRTKFLASKVSKALLSNENFTQSIVGKPGSKNDVVFCVENSISLWKDDQARLLRKAIMDVASSSLKSKKHVPIKWLKVSDFISKYKSSSTHTCLMDKRALLDKLRQEGVVQVEDEAEEFEEMLQFYDEIGEIKVMGDVVVLNLKALVQLVVELVELDCDDHELGIVHVSSFRRVWKFLTAESFFSTIALLERYDILCPISREQYLVPLLLKTINETTAKKVKQDTEETDHSASAFWDTSDSDTVIYFKFYRFYPEAIFLHLLARCLSISQKTHDLGRGADRDVYRDVGRFYQGHDFYYRLELVCQSVEQNMIQVTVKCAPDRGAHSLLSRLHKDLQQIRDREFPNLHYTLGLSCPACRLSNHERDERTPHILRIAGHDEELPRPGEKVTLMCRGKTFDLDLGGNEPSWDIARQLKTEESTKTPKQKGT